jgi:TIR domain
VTAIVISYRREDSQAITGRIFDRLESVYGQGHVFMDIDNIPFGTDFRHHLQETLDRCDILLVIVGPRWLGRKEDGQPRLFEEADWVRLEVTTALKKKIPVIPVLVEGARMPKSSELPADLENFAFRQAATIDIGVDFRVHVERLVKSMDRILALKRSEKPRAVPEDAPSIKGQNPAILAGEIPLTEDNPPPPTALKPKPSGGEQFDESNAIGRSPLAKPEIPNAPVVMKELPRSTVSETAVLSPDARKDERNEIDERQPALALANELTFSSKVPEVEKTNLPPAPKTNAYRTPLALFLAACLCLALVYLFVSVPNATMNHTGPAILSVPAAPQAVPTVPPQTMPTTLPLISGCDVFRTTSSKGGKLVALFIADYAKGVNAAWPAREIIDANGFKVAYDERIPLNAPDYSVYLLNARIALADFIVFCGPSNTVAKQGRQLGIIQ